MLLTMLVSDGLVSCLILTSETKCSNSGLKKLFSKVYLSCASHMLCAYKKKMEEISASLMRGKFLTIKFMTCSS